MADFLDATRNDIGSRLKELKPLVAEYQRLEAAAAALDAVPRSSASAPAAAPAARRRRSARTAAAAPADGTPNGNSPSKRPRGRPRGTGTRGKEALAVVQANPGITISEIAEQMHIKRNYLYRLLPDLARDGHVSTDGRGWRATTPTA